MRTGQEKTAQFALCQQQKLAKFKRNTGMKELYVFWKLYEKNEPDHRRPYTQITVEMKNTELYWNKNLKNWHLLNSFGNLQSDTNLEMLPYKICDDIRNFFPAHLSYSQHLQNSRQILQNFTTKTGSSDLLVENWDDIKSDFLNQLRWVSLNYFYNRKSYLNLWKN